MRSLLRSIAVFAFLATAACGPADSGAPTGERAPETRQTHATKTNGVTPQVEWVREIRTMTTATSIAVDARGDVYVAGNVAGALPGFPNGYLDDPFVRKYDAAGDEIWTRQFDLGGQEQAVGLAVDDTGVYITGRSFSISTVSSQRFVRKYAVDGDEMWTAVFDSGPLSGRPIALGTTGLYLLGNWFGPGPGDTYVRKYDRRGDLQWRRVYGPSAFDVAADSGQVYLAGDTREALPGQVLQGLDDAYVRALDEASGDVLWTRQFGTPADDSAKGIAQFDGRVHVVGSTDGTFPGQIDTGADDLFVRTFDADGNVLWTDQFGGPNPASSESPHVDANATGVYVAWGTINPLPGPTGTATVDMVARKYGSDGQPVWTLQFGVDGFDRLFSLAAGDDAVYVAGYTSSTGAFDDSRAFVAKVGVAEQPPQPPPECVTIDADVTVRSAADIRRLNEVEGCFDITGGLFVQGTTAVSNLEFLTGLRHVGGYVAISDNRDLQTLDGLETLQEIGQGLVIEGNASLAQVTSLQNLERVREDVHIFGNPALRAVEFPALRFALGALLVAGNDALTSLRMPALGVAGSVRIENNDALREVSMPVFEFVISGDLMLRFNRSLETFALPSLIRVGVGQTLEIRHNASLRMVRLPNLEELARLVIVDNDRLATIEAVATSAGRFVRAVQISDNAVLPTCEAEAIVDAIGQANLSEVIISGNDPNGTCP